MTIRAVLWEKDAASEGGVLCRACAHGCRIRDGAAGRCRVRVNKGGVLYSLSSGQVVACNLDPVEKKPLYHFLPGTTTLSFGTPGCNMTCAFCQNHALSQGNLPQPKGTAEALPDTLVSQTVASAIDAGAASVSFTYNEPCVSPELILAVAPRARDAGLATILVSNAYAGPASMDALRDCVRAANFDLKSFSDDFYATLCGARLAPVLRTIAQAVAFGWWVEITTLLIPGHNDSDAELKAIATFIKENLGAHVPWHVSRFRPMFRMPDVSPTPVASLERACAIGTAEGLHFVYAGNVPGHDAENTRCPACGAVALRRVGYLADTGFDGACPSCGQSIPGVWRTE
ncbi:Radical SAM domain protein [uncultured delta proteobacterium]|uniref:Radical SAM domain protein n=1 Tax=uncultured delta proteobacterium TaxID=34034 RepID=A0A212KC25_9DELT|nr:Radical SAM domain protein [uncultured delta proteobacterium]